MPNTIRTLEKLGYTIGNAYGSVQVEEDALAVARQDASPGVVIEQAGAVADATVTDLANTGKLPVSAEDRRALVDRILADAIEMVSGFASERVKFHTRAVAKAKAMPDVWCVKQIAGDAVVLQTYVATKPDGTGWDEGAQAALDALADVAGFAEREYQGLNPDAMQAAQTLVSLGRVCSRPKPGADTFDVDGATYCGAELVAFAAKVALEPPPPSTAEKVAAALSSVSELGAKSKQALLDALA